MFNKNQYFIYLNDIKKRYNIEDHYITIKCFNKN